MPDALRFTRALLGAAGRLLVRAVTCPGPAPGSPLRASFPAEGATPAAPSARPMAPWFRGGVYAFRGQR